MLVEDRVSVCRLVVTSFLFRHSFTDEEIREVIYKIRQRYKHKLYWLEDEKIINLRDKMAKKVKKSKDITTSVKSKVDKPRINADTMLRSEYNNKIVERMEFTTPSGKNYVISGSLLSYYTLTPRKPLIDCPYIRIKQTKSENCDDIFNIRICEYNKVVPEPCRITDQKLADGTCVGRKSLPTSIEFWITMYGNIENGEGKKLSKIAFLNKNTNMFTKQEITDNPDPVKEKSLLYLYQAIKSGIIKLKGTPKPGNNLFHTLFSGIIDVDIETITGEQIRGTVKGYENTPGGIPSLNIWKTQQNIRIVPLYTISTMFIGRYIIPDLVRKRTLELLLKGHITIPHPDNNSIYDYCKRHKLAKDQVLRLDGTIDPFDQLDRHDTEVLNIIREIT